MTDIDWYTAVKLGARLNAASTAVAAAASELVKANEAYSRAKAAEYDVLQEYMRTRHLLVERSD